MSQKTPPWQRKPGSFQNTGPRDLTHAVLTFKKNIKSLKSSSVSPSESKWFRQAIAILKPVGEVTLDVPCLVGFWSERALCCVFGVQCLRKSQHRIPSSKSSFQWCSDLGSGGLVTSKPICAKIVSTNRKFLVFKVCFETWGLSLSRNPSHT